MIVVQIVCIYRAAMVHDAADSDSETEALQEAATVTGAGGAGFGAENDVPPAAEREVRGLQRLYSHACGGVIRNKGL